MGLRLYYCDQYPIPLPPAHKFPLAKYARIRQHLAADSRFELIPAPLADPHDIQFAHDPGYVCAILDGTVDPRVMRRIGFPWSEHLVRRTLASVGGTLAAARRALTSGVSGNLAGGTHHAFRAEGSGFCVFNDPAVVIAHLKSRYNLKRIVYLDIDAHHGDGVMYGYYDDPSVLDIDFHESGNFLFPGTGFPDEIGKGEARRLKLNIPLPPSTGDEAYLEAFQQIVPDALKKFRPEIILVQCGADGHVDDRLAHLRLTTRVYSEVVSEVHDLAHQLCNGRLLLFGGGGYTLANVPRVWTVAFSTLAGVKASDDIPSEWSKEFERVAKEDPPLKLYDKPTSDDEKTLREVRKTVTELQMHLADQSC